MSVLSVACNFWSDVAIATCCGCKFLKGWYHFGLDRTRLCGVNLMDGAKGFLGNIHTWSLELMAVGSCNLLIGILLICYLHYYLPLLISTLICYVSECKPKLILLNK